MPLFFGLSHVFGRVLMWAQHMGGWSLASPNLLSARQGLQCARWLWRPQAGIHEVANQRLGSHPAGSSSCSSGTRPPRQKGASC